MRFPIWWASLKIVAAAVLATPLWHGLPTAALTHGLLTVPPSVQTSANVQRIRAIAFSPDGKLLAGSVGTIDHPGAVTVWEITTGKEGWTHREKKTILSVVFAPDGQSLAIGVQDGNAKLLDAANGMEQKSFHHPHAVRAVAFSPNGKLLAAAAGDMLVHIWDPVSGIEKTTFKGHTDSITGVQFSSNGALLISAGGKDGVKLWDVSTGMERRSLGQKSALDHTFCAAITPDDKWILNGDNGTLGVWNLQTGELRTRLTDTAGVNGLTFCPSSKELAICAFLSKDVYLYDLNLAEPTAAQGERIKSLLIQLDDDAYEVREAASREFAKIGLTAEPALRQAMKDAASVEVRIRARHARYEILSKPKAVLRGHTEEVHCVAFAPDGKLLASGSADGTVRLWEMPGGKEAGVLVPK